MNPSPPSRYLSISERVRQLRPPSKFIAGSGLRPFTAISSGALRSPVAPTCVRRVILSHTNSATICPSCRIPGTSLRTHGAIDIALKGRRQVWTRSSKFQRFLTAENQPSPTRADRDKHRLSHCRPPQSIRSGYCNHPYRIAGSTSPVPSSRPLHRISRSHSSP